jgi:hypothetical protein
MNVTEKRGVARVEWTGHFSVTFSGPKAQPPALQVRGEFSKAHRSADSSLEAGPGSPWSEVKIGQIHVAKNRTYSCCVDRLFAAIDRAHRPEIYFRYVEAGRFIAKRGNSARSEKANSYI